MPHTLDSPEMTTSTCCISVDSSGPWPPMSFPEPRPRPERARRRTMALFTSIDELGPHGDVGGDEFDDSEEGAE